MQKKHLSILVITLLCCEALFAQNLQLYSIAYRVGNGTDWVKFKTEKKLPAITVLNTNKAAFGFSENDEMKLVRAEKDGVGMEHLRFQQHYFSIPVEGAEYLIHARNGFAVSGNGKTATGINADIIPKITSAEAIQKALDHIGAKHYQWEDAGAEEVLKTIKKNPNATFYPFPELVITSSDLTSNKRDYKLAYKMNIYAYEPLVGKTVYVDAHTGEIIYTLELIHTGDVTATAVTKYSGNQTIITDMVNANLFQLRETGRAGGIRTFNMQKKITYGSAIDFTDNDNYWDNVNAFQDEAATDVHWATELTYDYYIQRHNRNSFDNLGTMMQSYVHYSSNYLNAFWNGLWMTYGDGGSGYTALTPVDISGHEMTHGVTQFASGLVYQNEPGSLNESFSDIFGTCIEFFAKPATANWTIAEDIGTPFRSMSNPKLYDCPDTYQGLKYYNGTLDQGGVHTNSGVQNKWFYTLSVGDTGVNDLGNAYLVTGIGIDKAAQIAYRNLSVYMTKTSKYVDARQGSIWAAEDLFGVCSPEALETANAWYSVGVGDPISNQDIGLLKMTTVPTACGLSNAENISFLFRNNGCAPVIAGDTVFVAYRLDSTIVTRDTVVLSAPLAAADSLTYNFTKKVDLSAIGFHTIDGWIYHKGDTLQFNDTIKTRRIENKKFQNTDIKAIGLASPKSGCALSAAETMSVKFKFNGCDSLSSNEKIAFAYRINKGIILKDTLVLLQKITPVDTLIFSFKQKQDLSTPQSYYFDVWADNLNDTTHMNDSILNVRVNNPVYVGDKTITFEDSIAVVDSFYVTVNRESSVYVSSTAAKPGSVYGLRMTGGNWMNKRSNYKGPNDLNAWTVNKDFFAEACFCVDASAWSSANMRFDMKQTYNYTYGLNIIGYNFPLTSNLRITVNGTQIGNTYNPKQKKVDPWVTRNIDLSAYAGTQFTLCFQTKNYLDQKSESIAGGLGDNAFLDNIYFSQDSVTGIIENSNNINFSIYPNPGNDKFTVSYRAAIPEEKLSIELTDVLGRVLLNVSKQTEVGTNTISINTSDFPAGVYTVRLLTLDGVGVRRVVVR